MRLRVGRLLRRRARDDLAGAMAVDAAKMADRLDKLRRLLLGGRGLDAQLVHVVARVLDTPLGAVADQVLEQRERLT